MQPNILLNEHICIYALCMNESKRKTTPTLPQFPLMNTEVNKKDVRIM